jgi:hypothetical protein
MKKIYFCIIVIIVFYASNSHSGTQVLDKTIIDIAMGWGGEGVYVTVEESFSLPEGCTSERFIMPQNTPLFKENLSVLLSAFHTNTKIRLYVDGCRGNSMHLKAVGMSK